MPSACPCFSQGVDYDVLEQKLLYIREFVLICHQGPFCFSGKMAITKDQYSINEDFKESKIMLMKLK